MVTLERDTMERIWRGLNDASDALTQMAAAAKKVSAAVAVIACALEDANARSADPIVPDYLRNAREQRP